jgi:hypothetical protein
MNALLAFPNLPTTPNPKSRTRTITTPKPVQVVFDALRIRNPSLSMEVFQQFLIVMRDESATAQVEQMIIESRNVGGVPAEEQMQSALADYVDMHTRNNCLKKTM